MPRIICSPDAPSGPWTKINPCALCHKARKARERPGILRRLLRIPRQPDPSRTPSVCYACGVAGSETITFNNPNWNPEHHADLRVEEPVGPTDETRADDIFGPPTPLGRPTRRLARLKPMEEHPGFETPSAHDIAWARAIEKSQNPERSASDRLKMVWRMADSILPSRGPPPPLTSEESRRQSQEWWHQTQGLRRTKNRAKPRFRPRAVFLPAVLKPIPKPIPEQDEPEEESRTRGCRHS
ncbi:hypothetical protein CTA2_7658 [Colletotrichum tanaceti]|uniref:Uncharacterized protein n=1 Tax=Colletotrichum tanaceti TaxID=1306861 RepID=A0A4V6DGQ1_9PEZI|nr:hypothetical protein CTA2_7658 [Colletotrichum tanaceti]TKW53626.1 hypothetical protein CTA1_10565 [Colletotrichum tanaceti]